MGPHEELVRLVRGLPSTEVQNSLMPVTDRELALAMMYLSDSDRQFVLGFLGKAKAARVADEYSLQKGLKITYPQYRNALDSLIEQLKSGKPQGPMKSYLRPVRGSRRSRRR